MRMYTYHNHNNFRKIVKALGQLWWDDYVRKILRSSNKSYINTEYGYILNRLSDMSIDHDFSYLDDVDDDTNETALKGLKKLHLLSTINITKQGNKVSCHAELNQLGKIYANYLYPHHDVIMWIQDLITDFFIIVPVCLMDSVTVLLYLYVIAQSVISILLLPIGVLVLSESLIICLKVRIYPRFLYHNKRSTKKQFIRFIVNHRNQSSIQQQFEDQHYNSIQSTLDNSMFD